MPDAAIEVEESADTDKEKTEDGYVKPDSKAVVGPSLQFSHVECALFALHCLCRQAPDALGADADRLKTLRLRLQYTARLTQGYIKKLKEVTQVLHIYFVLTKFLEMLEFMLILPTYSGSLTHLSCGYRERKTKILRRTN